MSRADDRAEHAATPPGHRSGPAAQPGGARDEILARLRAARPTAPVPVPRDYQRPPDPPSPRPESGPGGDGAGLVGDGAGLVELFVDRVTDYRATVHRTRSAELPAVLAGVLASVPTLAVPSGVPAGWLAEYSGRVRRDGEATPLTVPDLDEPGLAVLTGCAVAVAVTGTLILAAGADQGRRLLTLVPDHHVCVVRVDQIVAGVPAALGRLTDPTRPLTMISGPSATSDIELDRVEGVHGPRRLVVIVVDG